MTALLEARPETPELESDDMSPRAGTWGAFPGTDRVLLGVTVALALAMAFGLAGPVQLVLALAFLCFVPGWAVMVGRGPRAGADRVALSVVLGLSISTLLTSLALWVHLWHPAALFVLVAVPSGVALTVDLHRARRRRAYLRGVAVPALGRDEELESAGSPLPPRWRRSERWLWQAEEAAGLGERAPRRWITGLHVSDALLVAALVVWLLTATGIDPSVMNGYGLLPALPIGFLMTLVVLAGSFAWELSRAVPSPARLAARVVALVLVLHGTVPLVFPEPRYAWVYKHLGVVNYINLRGHLNASIDIYQNWPGFFALTAWLTKLGGQADPISYVAWAQVTFNLLFTLELAFLFRALRTPARVRWIALFLFVAANWVAQDYFAPQAFAFLLSLGLFGVLLQRLGPPMAWASAVEKFARRLLRARGEQGPLVHDLTEQGPRALDLPFLAVVLLLFGAMAVSHQLSPFIALLAIALLTAAGLRPRWLLFALIAPGLGYLGLRFGYVTQHYNLLGPLGRIFSNTHRAGSAGGEGDPGRLVIAQGAQALSLLVWGLAATGIVMRLRRGRPVLALAALAGAPVLMLLAQNYGGEAIYRVYLFSLPWCALLAASALTPERPWSSWHSLRVGLVLTTILGLFLPAYFGLDEVNEMRPAEVAASQYFYENAPSGVLVLAAPNFPVRAGGRYDEFKIPWGVHDATLTEMTDRSFRNRMLGSEDLEDIGYIVRAHEGPEKRGYLAISTSEKVFTQVYGVLPQGSLDSLDAALAHSPNWRVFYRTQDAVIYELLDQR